MGHHLWAKVWCQHRISAPFPSAAITHQSCLEVPAEEDAVLFMWATSPKLTEALEVMTAWGFSYRTCTVWVKDRIGMGYYARQQHELVLIGKRGHPKASTLAPPNQTALRF